MSDRATSEAFSGWAPLDSDSNSLVNVLVVPLAITRSRPNIWNSATGHWGHCVPHFSESVRYETEVELWCIPRESPFSRGCFSSYSIYIEWGAHARQTDIQSTYSTLLLRHGLPNGLRLGTWRPRTPGVCKYTLVSLLFRCPSILQAHRLGLSQWLLQSGSCGQGKHGGWRGQKLWQKRTGIPGHPWSGVRLISDCTLWAADSEKRRGMMRLSHPQNSRNDGRLCRGPGLPIPDTNVWEDWRLRKRELKQLLTEGQGH